MKRDGVKPELFHRTFQMPKRRDELLDGAQPVGVALVGVVQLAQAEHRESRQVGARPVGGSGAGLVVAPGLAVADEPIMNGAGA